MTAHAVRRRYVVVAALSPLREGDRFTTAAWPLHVTVVPTFFSTAGPEAVAAAVTRAAAGLRPVTVQVGGDALYGPRATVPVSEVVLDDDLRLVHHTLLDELRGTRIEHETPAYVGSGYGPHVTHTRDARLHPGDVRRLTQVALVDMQPGQPQGMRAVLAVAELAG